MDLITTKFDNKFALGDLNYDCLDRIDQYLEYYTIGPM